MQGAPAVATSTVPQCLSLVEQLRSPKVSQLQVLSCVVHQKISRCEKKEREQEVCVSACVRGGSEEGRREKEEEKIIFSPGVTNMVARKIISNM